MNIKQKVHQIWKLQTTDLPSYNSVDFLITKSDFVVGICISYKPTLCELVRLRRFSRLSGAKILSIINSDVTTYSDQNGDLLLNPLKTKI